MINFTYASVLSVCVHICLGAQRSGGRDRSLGAGLQAFVSCLLWELNSCPLAEQYWILTIETSLQPHDQPSVKCLCWDYRRAPSSLTSQGVCCLLLVGSWEGWEIRCPDIKQNRRAEDVAPVVEHLPSRPEAEVQFSVLWGGVGSRVGWGRGGGWGKGKQKKKKLMKQFWELGLNFSVKSTKNVLLSG